MANDISAPIGGSLATKIRTDVATLLNTALAPFSLQERWSRSIRTAREAVKFVALDQNGELVALRDDADWTASRAHAMEIQQKLPPLAKIAEAYKAVDQTIRVKPASEEYQLLTTKMLDVLGIRGGDDVDAYVEAVAWTLADVWPATWEPIDVPTWVPIPAFAKAIKGIWEDRSAWTNFGKPPPLPDIIERCTGHRRDLVQVRDNIDMLGRTRKRLSQIIQAVKEYEEDYG